MGVPFLALEKLSPYDLGLTPALPAPGIVDAPLPMSCGSWTSNSHPCLSQNAIAASLESKYMVELNWCADASPVLVQPMRGFSHFCCSPGWIFQVLSKALPCWHAARAGR